MSSPTFSSFSRYISTKHGHRIYAWCVFVDARWEVLRGIGEVEYTLHPSFSAPLRVVSDPTNCFVLQSEGWGEFQIRIRTSFIDGSFARSAFHLKLRDSEWPMGGPPTELDAPILHQVYGILIEAEWDWRRLSTIARKLNLSPEQVIVHLEALAEKRVARRAYYRSIDNEEMWGATSRVGLLPEPKS